MNPLFRISILVSTASLCLFSSCKKKSDPSAAQPGGPQGPMPVPVAKAEFRPLAESIVLTGRFIATESVAIRSRVSGYLDAVEFQEGQLVKEGAPLFRIDPRLFDAALASAEARIAQVQVQEKFASQQLNRAKQLIEQKAIAQEAIDERQAALDQAKADLTAAEAELKRARLNRDFADITAPISGIVGRYEVTPGNFINGGSAGAEVLTTIIPQDPIDCQFELDERQALTLLRKKASSSTNEAITVEIALSDRADFEFKGTVNFQENQLTPGTATLTLRARIQNPKGLLTPGLFGRVRLPISEKPKAMMVPESALGFDQDKRFLWVLQPDQTLAKRFVEIGASDGAFREVLSGLQAQDSFAVGRLQFIRPAMPIQPLAPETTPSAAQ